MIADLVQREELRTLKLADKLQHTLMESTKKENGRIYVDSLADGNYYIRFSNGSICEANVTKGVITLVKWILKAKDNTITLAFDESGKKADVQDSITEPHILLATTESGVASATYISKDEKNSYTGSNDIKVGTNNGVAGYFKKVAGADTFFPFSGKLELLRCDRGKRQEGTNKTPFTKLKFDSDDDAVFVCDEVYLDRATGTYTFEESGTYMIMVEMISNANITPTAYITRTYNDGVVIDNWKKAKGAKTFCKMEASNFITDYFEKGEKLTIKVGISPDASSTTSTQVAILGTPTKKISIGI